MGVLIFSFLLGAYGAAVLLSVSFQYALLRKRWEFGMGCAGFLGMVIFGFFSALETRFGGGLARAFAMGGLGLLSAALSFFYFRSHDSFRFLRSLPVPVLSFPVLVVFADFVGGGKLSLLFLFLALAGVGWIAFVERHRYRLPFRFFVFFSFFFVVGLILFSPPLRMAWGGLFLLLSFVFAYRIISFFLASSFIKCRMNNVR